MDGSFIIFKTKPNNLSTGCLLGDYVGLLV